MGVDRQTTAVALALWQEHAQNLKAVLDEFDDTTRHLNYRRYREIIMSEGFHLEHCAPVSESHREERWYHEHGLEASVRVEQSESPLGEVERVALRYNWVPVGDDPGWRIHGSGTSQLLQVRGVERPVYVSTLDVTLAFRFKLARLRAFGRFLCPWYDEPPA